jgi:hypothetical protein
MRKLFLLLAVLALAGCVSSEVDPRCRIEAPGNYRARRARHVNGSKLWSAYFETMAPRSGGTVEPWIDFRLAFDRDVLERSEILEYEDGDYEAGSIDVEFIASNRRNGASLYRREKNVPLPEFAFVDSQAKTREQIQKAVFEQTEDKIFPYLDRWVNVAAVRAMGLERGAPGEAFIPILEEQANDSWAEDLASEAQLALRQIRGETTGSN